jgi:starch synthase (maltosyl-transferring)
VCIIGIASDLPCQEEPTVHVRIRGGPISDRVQAQIALNLPAIQRVIIEGIQPQVDGGRFPIKRTIGEKVLVEADIFADGHEVLSAAVLYRPERAKPWREAPMRFFDNDRWRGEFEATELGTFVYTIQAWVDAFQTWTRDFFKKYDAGQDVSVDVLDGAELVRGASKRASAGDAQRLSEFAAALTQLSSRKIEPVAGTVRSAELAELMARYPDRVAATTYPVELRVIVDRERARFSAWYEMFPRSCTADPARHGTFLDCIERLDYVAGMGFDVLYLPPIHPIGRKGRKGKNNQFPPAPDDTGSPWAIGASEGGHRRSILSWERLRISRSCKAKLKRAVWNWRSISRSNVRRITPT